MNTRPIALFLALLAAFATVAAPVEHVTTNGRITIAVNEDGELSYFSWPGPGRGQHLGEAGAHWLLGDLASREKLTGEHWQIEQGYQASDSWSVVTRYTERKGARSAEQTVTAAPGGDCVMIRIRLRGFAPDISCFWVQSMEPFDRRPTGFAGLQPELRALNVFASHYDEHADLLLHFSPTNAGRAARRASLAWVENGSSADLGPGIYIGAVSPNEIVNGTIYPVDSSAQEWEVDSPFPGVGRHLGHATGSLKLVPRLVDADQEFVVVLGASDTQVGLRTLLTEALNSGADLHDLSGSPPADPALQRARLNLLSCLDGESAAVLHAPALPNSATYCNVLDTAWASAAMDGLGLHDQAAQALAVHVDAIRRTSSSDAPAGSLPRMIYPDGAAASLWGNADPESVAWLLAACWRHAATLPEAERATYLEPQWSALSLCADYLARDPGVGGALSGALTADAAPLDTLRVHYLGLESSRRMAEALGAAEPGLWADRRDEIYARLRFRTLNQSGGDKSETPWVDWWVMQMPGAKSDAGRGWEVLKSGAAPALTDEAVTDWTGEEGLGPEAPLALRDALRCLMATGSDGG